MHGQRNTLIESHSIDFVPQTERHGSAWHQAPFWFAGNFVLPIMLTGTVGPLMGLSTYWTVIAIVVGVSIGTVFVGFHANQGPRLGLPQMIQSRAQFGSKGALFPVFAALIVYVGFCVFNIISAQDAVSTTSSAPAWIWYLIFTVLSLLLAVGGHDLLHVAQRYTTWILIPLFAVLSVYAVATLPSATGNGFVLSAFIGQAVAAFAFQLSLAVFVSDYTRYLPSDVSSKSVISWTFVGMWVSAVWLMSLGGLLSTAVGDASDPIPEIATVGNNFASGFGTIVVLVAILPLITITGVEMYGGTLVSLTAIDPFKRVPTTRVIRVIGTIVIALISFVILLGLPSRYLGTFNDFLGILIVFLVPWTAVNLTDFYLVRRGEYSSAEIINPRGQYGLWRADGIVSYLLGLACMVPFVHIGDFAGPAAVALGADMSPIVGVVVSCILFFLVSRSRKRAKDLPSTKPTGTSASVGN